MKSLHRIFSFSLFAGVGLIGSVLFLKNKIPWYVKAFLPKMPEWMKMRTRKSTSLWISVKPWFGFVEEKVRIERWDIIRKDLVGLQRATNLLGPSDIHLWARDSLLMRPYRSYIISRSSLATYNESWSLLKGLGAMEPIRRTLLKAWCDEFRHPTTFIGAKSVGKPFTLIELHNKVVVGSEDQGVDVCELCEHKYVYEGVVSREVCKCRGPYPCDINKARFVLDFYSRIKVRKMKSAYPRPVKVLEAMINADMESPYSAYTKNIEILKKGLNL